MPSERFALKTRRPGGKRQPEDRAVTASPPRATGNPAARDQRLVSTSSQPAVLRTVAAGDDAVGERRPRQVRRIRRRHECQHDHDPADRPREPRLSAADACRASAGLTNGIMGKRQLEQQKGESSAGRQPFAATISVYGPARVLSEGRRQRR